MIDFESKYAPKRLADIVWEDTKTMKKITSYVNTSILRPLVLYGPFGTGKTTIATLLPKEIEPSIQPPDIKLMNAGIDRNITALNKIFDKKKMTCGVNNSGLKVFIFDEAEGIKDDAYLALRGIVKQWPTGVLFIFTTNNLQNVDSGICSRSACVQINSVDPSKWLPRAQFIMEQEGHPRSKEKLLPLIKAAKGDSRQILQNLQELVIDIEAKAVPKINVATKQSKIVARISP